MHVLDHADYTAPARQHELHHAHQEVIYQSALKYLDYEVGINDL